MNTITDPKMIHALQLRAQLSSMKLEGIGMKRRGRSMTAMLKDVYGLPKSTPREDVMKIVKEEIETLDAEILKEAQGRASQ